MVAFTKHDLQFILDGIDVSEGHAASTNAVTGGTWTVTDLETSRQILLDLLPNSLEPIGMRTISGELNNLVAGQEDFGATGEFPRLLDPNFRDDGKGALPLGPPLKADFTPVNFALGEVPFDFGFGAQGVPPGYIPADNNLGPGGTDLPSNWANNNDYGQPGNVVDSSPRTISNLIVDQSITNPAALVAALQVAGSDDPGGDAAAIQAAHQVAEGVDVAAAQAALQAANDALANSPNLAAVLLAQTQVASAQADLDGFNVIALAAADTLADAQAAQALTQSALDSANTTLFLRLDGIVNTPEEQGIASAFSAAVAQNTAALALVTSTQAALVTADASVVIALDAFAVAQTNLADAQAASAASVAAVTAAQTVLSDAQGLLDTANTVAADAVVLLSDAVAARVVTAAAFVDAGANLLTALNTLVDSDLEQAAFDAVTTAHNADQDAQTAVTNAQVTAAAADAVAAAAVDDVATATTDLATAVAAAQASAAVVVTSQATVDAAVIALDGATTAAADAEVALADAPQLVTQATLAQAAVDLIGAFVSEIGIVEATGAFQQASIAHAAAMQAVVDAEAALVTANADVVTATTELTNAENQLVIDQAAAAADQADVVSAQTALTDAQSALTAADIVALDAATVLNAAVASQVTTAATLAAATATLDARTNGIIDTPEEIALHTAFYDALAADTAAAQAVIDAQAVSDAADADVVTKQALVDAVATSLTNAQAAGDADLLALNAAQTAHDDAQGVLSAATLVAANASTALTDAQAAQVVTQAAVDLATANLATVLNTTIDTPEEQAALDAVTTAGTANDAALVVVSDAQIAFDAAAADVTTATAVVAAAQTQLTIAEAAIAVEQQAVDDAQAVLDAATAAVGAFTTLVAAAGIEVSADGLLFIENVAPDEGLSAPFNSWMTFFGQFFDHGLDLVAKGGNGTVFIPLQPDDPIIAGDDGIFGTADDLPTHLRFMTVTRATVNADGIDGTADDHEAQNFTSPFVDQNQTYTSHPSHQIFVRQYVANTVDGLTDSDGNPIPDGAPVATGLLIEGAGGGMATWGEVKAQAATFLGIELTDAEALNIPLFAVDQYGEFIRGANGLPQMVIQIEDALGTVVTTLVEGNLTDPVSVQDAIDAVSLQVDAVSNNLTVSESPTGFAFLLDIAHNAAPAFDGTGALAPDADNVAGNPIIPNARGQNEVYDDELLNAHFIAGDGRANENIGLTAVHHVFHQEHNRIVEHTKEVLLSNLNNIDLGTVGDEDGADVALDLLNGYLRVPLTELPVEGIAINDPSLVWDGDRLFQAAKFATEMQYQHLVFEEFARKVQPLVDLFASYETSIDASIVAEFAHVVYRFGHSMLTESVDVMDAEGNLTEVGLIEAFLNPFGFHASVQADGTVDAGAEPSSSAEAAGAIIRGLTRQTGNAIDEFVTDALRDNLLGLPLDLAAINIARGRETGMPTLNEARADFFAGTGDTKLKPYDSWVDFALNLKHGGASIINFVASYGQHETITDEETLIGKRAASMALTTGVAQTVMINGVEEVFNPPADRLDFLNSTGTWAGVESGLNLVDFWIGGLAETTEPFGGMLGSTFNFVFEQQLEDLQDGDRFYYLGRVGGLNFLSQLEQNSFANMIIRNTDIGDEGGDHLPGDIFSTPAFILEVDQSRQVTGIENPDGSGDLNGDPTGEGVSGGELNPFLDIGTNSVVIRDDPNTVGPDTNYLRYTGGDHVVLGGTNENDTIIGGIGDDTLWGDGGDDNLEGGDGGDIILGGTGDDVITDIGGVNNLQGQDGNDAISAGGGESLILAGAGQDFVLQGPDLAETFAGLGNDFVHAGDESSIVFGNEGDDWLEGGGGNNLMVGDNGDPFLNSTAGGNDVFISGLGDDDYDSEGGDDIMEGADGIQRFEGLNGFDWATYKDVDLGVNVDMLLRAFDETPLPASNVSILDRFDSVEGLSGSRGGDILRGSNQTDVVITALNNGNNSVLTNFDLIDGLRGDGVETTANSDVLFNADVTSWGEGDIILGGAGSDVIEGRGGNDIIDGDLKLDVALGWIARDAAGVEIARGRAAEMYGDLVVEDGTLPEGITNLQQAVFARVINPGDIQIIREIIREEAVTDAVVASQATVDAAVIALDEATTAAADAEVALADAQQAQLVTQATLAQASVDLIGAFVSEIGIVEATGAFQQASIANAAAMQAVVDAEAALVAANTNVVTATTALATAEDQLALDQLALTPPFDTAEFSDVRANYTIETDGLGAIGDGNNDGFIEVSHNSAANVVDGLGADGVDLIRNIERLTFSDQTINLSNANALATGAPSIVMPGTTTLVADPVVGQELEATAGTVADADGTTNATFSFTWQVEQTLGQGDFIDLTVFNAAGEVARLTGTTIEVPLEAEGLALRVRASFQDDAGVIETVFSASTNITAPVSVGVATTGPDTLLGTIGPDVIDGLAGDDVIFGLAGNDVLIGGPGNDILNGGDGNDEILWMTGDGRDLINGNGGAADVVDFTGDATAEIFRVYAVSGAANAAQRTALEATFGVFAANTEIVVTRDDGTEAVIAELDNIEELIFNGQTAAAAGNNVAGDTVIPLGNFGPTSLALATITVNGTTGDDVVDISQLDSAHRIVFRSNGGNDMIVGTLRPQDVVELAPGLTAADYGAPQYDGNGMWTVTQNGGGHSVSYAGDANMAPPMFATPTAIGANGFEYTASDIRELKNLVRGEQSDLAEDFATGIRDLEGTGNNVANPDYGSADQPFIRLTDARYGAVILEDDGHGNMVAVNREINPIFEGLDPREISNILGHQEADLPTNSEEANIFFMAFGQYFDHGLDFLPKGGHGTIAIGDPNSSDDPADLTRGSIDSFDADNTPQHLNMASPFVDQNQAYGSTELVGQFLRGGDGHGGLGSHLFSGKDDPSNANFKMLPTLEELIMEHWVNDTVFTDVPGGSSPDNTISFRDYFTDLPYEMTVGGNVEIHQGDLVSMVDGEYVINNDMVPFINGNFMETGFTLIGDANPTINLLDHYVAGDLRANENYTLTSMHTIWARNHNYHVESLVEAGFVGSAEELFQAAKIVNESEYQRVVFDEFADKLIGGIKGSGSHGFDDYKPEVDAQISHEFAAAVYRVGHSLISQNIEILDVHGNTISVPLTSAFLNPTNDDDAVKDGYLDHLPAVRPEGFEQHGVEGIIEGIISQPAEEVDFNIVDAVRNDLVNIRADLFAFNVARGWDVGLGTMNQVRADLMASDDPYVKEAVERSGEDLTPYSSWEDFRDRNGLSAAVIAQFIAAYPDLAVAADDYPAFAEINGDIGEEQSDGSYMVKGIDRVDLWVGGLAEEHINGGMVGSTFWVVLHEQFDRLQEGDRFYYLSRVDDFDFYGHVKEQTFADIVARNTGIEGLPEDIFSTDARSDTSTTTATDQNDNPDDSTDTINDGNGTDTGNDNNGPDNGDAMPFVAAMLLTGDAGSNTLVGNTNGDILAGLEGNDALLAGEGDNVVYAGDGNDEVITGSGNDIVLGGDGNDMIMTGDGNDIIDGGLGRDLVQAGDGDDLVLARFDDGNDVYNGGLGNDTIDLSAITAAATIDLGIGRVSSDQTGSDMISGFENAVGGQGNDLIIANGEVNVLTGGHGEDTFEFRSAAGANNDSITDFEQGDSINLSGVFGGQDVTFMEGTTFAPGGQVIIYSEGDDAIIEGDADNDGNADFAITLVGRADLGEFTP